jgi:large subunit ribosomal protein L9
MEVILRDEIEKLGIRGDVVKVADGYARNYLLPRRLAVAATPANKKIVEQERGAYLRRQATLKAEAEELAKLMEGVSVTIEHKAGEQEQLFGSVTARNIADALAKQNYTVDHRKIQLDDPIRQLGEYKVGLKLHREVVVEVAVNVTPEGGVVVKSEAPAEEDGAAEAEGAAEEATPAAAEEAEATEVEAAGEKSAEEPKEE